MSSVIAAARALIGKPFRHMGRGPTHYDCGGVIVAAYAAIGVVVHDIQVYGREPHMDGLRSTLQRTFGEPVTDGARAGDVLLMRFLREPHHLALVADHPSGIGLSMIHADGSVGRVVEHRIDSMWAARILEVYRWLA